jgi:hypothetical protein
MPEASYDEVAAFQKRTSDLSRSISSAGRQLGEAAEKLRFIKVALTNTPAATPELFNTLAVLNSALFDLRSDLEGDGVRQGKDVSTSPSIRSRVGGVIYGHWDTTELPTETQKRSIELAQIDFDIYLQGAIIFFNDLTDYESTIEKAGAPYTPGRKME